MFKFILFALIVFTLSTSTHNIHGQLVPVQNNTEIDKQNNELLLLHLKYIKTLKKSVVDISFIPITDFPSDNYFILDN